MAEAARKLPTSVPLGGSFRSSAAPANSNNAPIQDALRFHSNRLLDQRAQNTNSFDEGDIQEQSDTVSDSSAPSDSSLGSEEAPLLALKPKSYTQREATEESLESDRQHALSETQRRFTEPGRSLTEISETSSFPSEGSQRQVGYTQERTAPEQTDTQRSLVLQQSMARDGQRERQAQAKGQEQDKIAQAERAAKTLRDVRKLRRLYATIVRVVELVLAETIFPLIKLIFDLNVETWNILLFHVDVPEPMGTGLATMGINLSYDKKEGFFTLYNIVVVAITFWIDFMIFIILLPLIIILCAAIIFLTMGIFDVVSFFFS